MGYDFQIPIKVEVKASAGVSYPVDFIRQRLAEIAAAGNPPELEAERLVLLDALSHCGDL